MAATPSTTATAVADGSATNSNAGARGGVGVAAMEELVAIIQAPSVLNGRTEPNLEILAEAGYHIIQKRKFEMSEAEAQSISSSDELRRLYLGGPVVAALLRRENAYDSWERVRRELDDTYSSTNSFIALRDKYAFFPTSRVLERMVIVVKPDHKQSDFNAVMETLERHDFVVLDRVARQLSGEMVEQLFRERKNDDDDMKYLRSDVSMVLIVEKVGAIDEWRLLCGPDDPRIAKLLAPDTLHAKLGVDRIHNGIYASESAERALDDLKTVSSLFPGSFPLERTLAILKPDTSRLLDTIRDEIIANGFTILASEEMHVSQERAEQFYHSQRDRSFFETLTRYISSGACVALILAKAKAVDHWRKLVGPVDRTARTSSLRTRYGHDEIRNGFHASESVEAARDEITFFFPMLPAEKDDKTTRRQQVEDFLSQKPAPTPFAQPKKSFNDVLTDGLTQLCRVKPVGKDAILWLADWLLINNPNKPQVVHPEDVKVVSTSAAGTDDASIVWIIGGPGTNKNTLCSKIALDHGYEVLSCQELIRAAVASSTPYGDVIKQYQGKGSAIPCHVVSSLVTSAMASSRAARIAKGSAAAAAKTDEKETKRSDSSAAAASVASKKKDNSNAQARFIVIDFPYTLDQVFDFEQRAAAPTLVVYLDGAHEVLLKRAAEEKDTSTETKSSLSRRIISFKEDVQPIVEHYQVFHKLRSVPVTADDEALKTRLTRAIRGQIAQPIS